ncbi:MAG: ATP-binding protein [Sandaracinaceae bacterium]
MTRARDVPPEIPAWLSSMGSVVSVVAWSGEQPRRRLTAALEAHAGAVLVLVESDADEAHALHAGAPETLRWPSSQDVFEARVRRTERLATGTHARLHDDVADSVAAQTLEVREAAAQLHAVIHHLGEGVVAVGRDGRIKLWNPAAESLLGAIEPFWRQSIAFVHPHLAELVGSCLETDSSQRGEITANPEDGSHPRVMAVEVTPVFVDTPLDTLRSLGAVVLVRDVTLERQVDRMKTDFIATVSHELRTPLTSVLGFAKLARTKLDKRVAPALTPGDERADKALAQVGRNLEIIVREGKRLAALIDDVLDVSKMEAGRVDWQRAPLDAAALVARAVEVTQGLFEDTALRCETEVATDLPALTGDERRLLQVLINLVSNAVKFTPAGFVRIGARRGDAGVRFFVEDSGEGIPAGQRERIFDKFRQVANTLEDRPRGTGLGLTICRHIVEHHGGRISVAPSPSGGSLFEFELPARPAVPADGLLEHVESAVGAEGTAARILVVDDDEALRELLKQLLEDAGHDVDVAADGLAAVAQIRAAPPDLVILDVRMPGLSGFDVAALLRGDPLTEMLPIVVLSVVDDPGRATQLGVDRSLTKPLRPNELLTAIREIGRSKRGRAWLLMKPA